jgi:hypothetical protein
MPILTPAPAGHPAVSLVTTYRFESALNDDFALELAIHRAGAITLAGGAVPSGRRPVLFFNVTKELDELRADELRIRAELGIDPAVKLPLRLMGKNDTPNGYLFEQVEWGRAQVNAQVIIFAAASMTAGIGFCHESRDAWGLTRPWGPGRKKGPLGWQITYARQWGVEFVNFCDFANPRIGAVDKDETLANADTVSCLSFNDDDLDGDAIEAVITEHGQDTKLIKPRDSRVWQFAYREPTQP